MKIKNKFLTGALLTISALGVVGSISSTYAWYSYNTKDSIAYHGIATGNSQNLQVRLVGEDDTKWRTSITSDDLETYSHSINCAMGDLAPVSFIESVDKTTKISENMFYGSPTSGTNVIDTVGTKDGDYYVFMKVEFQVRSINPAQQGKLFEDDIWLSDIRCTTTTQSRTMADAVRVYFGTGESYHYLIKPADLSEETEVTTNLYGNLDMDGDGHPDEALFDNEPTTGHKIYKDNLSSDHTDDVEIMYGVEGVKETAYTRKGAVATFTDGQHDENTGIQLGKTADANAAPLTITMIVYLQGWDASCITSNIGAEFDLGFTIQTNKHLEFSGADEVEKAKAESVAEIENYKKDYCTGEDGYTEAVSAAKESINTAETKVNVESALASGKAAIDAIELAKAIRLNKAEIASYESSSSSLDGYDAAVSAAQSAIEGATTKADADAKLAAGKLAIDKIIAVDALNKYNYDSKHTSIDYASTIATWTEAINNATTKAGVDEALASGKEAIDALIVE